MKTYKTIRLGMIGMVALIALSFSSRAFAAIDAFLVFTDSAGKTTTVKLNPDGSFTTPALHAGTYRWSFGGTQSGVASSVAAGSNGKKGTDAGVTTSSGGDNPSESVTSSFAKIAVAAIVHDPASGVPSGKRMHKPFSITKSVDKASPKMMTAIGTFVIDANGETLVGTVVPLTQGGKTAMDSWDAK